MSVHFNHDYSGSPVHPGEILPDVFLFTVNFPWSGEPVTFFVPLNTAFRPASPSLSLPGARRHLLMTCGLWFSSRGHGRFRVTLKSFFTGNRKSRAMRLHTLIHPLRTRRTEENTRSPSLASHSAGRSHSAAGHIRRIDRKTALTIKFHATCFSCHVKTGQQNCPVLQQTLLRLLSLSPPQR